METTSSSSDGRSTRAFYLPAMGTLSSTPGRVVRFVSRHLDDHSVLVRSKRSPAPTRAFYLPATVGVTGITGRLERVASQLSENRDVRGRVTAAHEELREFYLPATARFADRRR